MMLPHTTQFEVRTLPQLPKEVLENFRKQLPAETLATARPVATRAIWDDAGTDEEENAARSAMAEKHEAEWAVVDERTMERAQFMRMRRGSLRPSAAPSYLPTHGPVTRSRKRRCLLSDSRGKVDVDYRDVGILKTFITEGGKIIPKRKSGLSAKAQRKVSRAIKAARTMALISANPKPRLTLEEMLEIEKHLP